MSEYYTMEAKKSLRSGCDTCKPFREGFNKMAESLASSKVSTTLFTILPMVSMTVALIYFETSFSTIYFNNQQYQITPYKYIILSPVIVVSSLTFIFGFLALLAIRFELQNLLGFCSFVYASIAYWAIINILIIVFCMVPYFATSVVGSILGWSIPSAFVWLFTSAVMDAHRKNVNNAISGIASLASMTSLVAADSVEEMV